VQRELPQSLTVTAAAINTANISSIELMAKDLIMNNSSTQIHNVSGSVLQPGGANSSMSLNNSLGIRPSLPLPSRFTHTSSSTPQVMVGHLKKPSDTKLGADKATAFLIIDEEQK
jgi:hypothetical protein